MSKNSKLVARLQARPKDFTWDELTSVLKHFGYQEKTGSGARRKFINSITDHKLLFHKPHPENVLKRYVIDEVIAALIENGLITGEEIQK
ncbi:MAG: type II toxin-antitoxin system HicA family toxin [Nitrosospira sp.]|nr:type II toxin-antitoxin system HicA family toxin [Nitrosospira sp.]